MAEQFTLPSFQRFDPGPILESPSHDSDVEMTSGDLSNEEIPSSVIVAVDFGTTFSSVAWSSVQRRPGANLLVSDIHCIDKYPDERPPPGMALGDPGSTSRQDVPTELWYTGDGSLKSRSQRQRSRQYTIPDIIEAESSNLEVESDSDGSRPSSDDSEAENEEGDRPCGQGERATLYWGFGVQKHMSRPDNPEEDLKRISRMKLVLGPKGEDTDGIRAEVLTTLKLLKKAHLVPRTATLKDIISDYLECLFTHTKAQLDSRGLLHDGIDIELVLCVPALWPSKACRIMQTAMAIAAQRAGLGRLVTESLNNLFIISEPEAAAALILEEDSNDVYPGEIILILDAGGGTIDAVTYEVTSSLPLRLSAEVVAPTNKLCGASYINERFAKLLKRKLRYETYLEKNGKTIRSIIEEQVIKFENFQKRVIDVTDRKCEIELVMIDDLRENAKKKFIPNRLEISRKDMIWVFKKSLDGAAVVLQQQLDMARANKFSVSKVLLTGGFGRSKSLQSSLKAKLASERNFDGHRISLLTTGNSSTTVARGAVMRAFNKELGPRRVVQTSYGILRTEPYEPDICPAHKKTKCMIDKADGERYVDDTITWLIKKGKVLEVREEFFVTVRQTFAENWTRLKCTETLYVSDDWHESHYRRKHPNNAGAELVGVIEFDMTFLKDEKRIEPQPPSEWSTFDPRTAKKHYVVKYELVLIVDGRNLYFEARYPARDDKDAMGEEERLLGRKQVSIAASFQPGTE